MEPSRATPVKPKLLGLLFIALFAAVACESEQLGSGTSTPVASVPTYVERDSAGIRVVENVRRSPEQVAWLLREEPRLSIGAVVGRDWEQLYRVMHARSIPGGRIAIANRGSNQVLVYDTAGEFLLAVGRTGSGPEEFRSVHWIGVGREDTIFVVDAQTPSSISVYTPTFEYRRRIPWLAPSFEDPILGEFADGSWLMMTRAGRDFQLAQDSATVWGVVRLLHVHATGMVREIPGVFPLQANAPSGRLIFGAFAAARPIGNNIAYARGDRHQIEFYSQYGALERIGRVDTPLRPVTAAMRDSAFTSVDPVTLTHFGNWRFADTMPAYNMANDSRAIVGSSTTVWLQRYQYGREAADSPRVWEVFHASGVFEGIVNVPARFTIFEIGTDYVLGSWRDEFDVEYVQIRDLQLP